MNIGKLLKLKLVLLILLLSTSAYAYNKNRAKNACINKVTEYGSSHYHDVSHVKVTDRGHHSYGVSGDIKSSRDNKKHRFFCNIRHKEVVKWKVNTSSGYKNHREESTVAGILAIEAMRHGRHRYNNHDSGGNPFSDMKYLKRQCKKNIRHHINGKVSKIRFDSAHLKHRKLRGTGYVIFRDGSELDLNYQCDFDRRGNIYDGHYRYRNNRYRR